MKHTRKAEEAGVQNNLTMGCSIFCSFHTIELEFVLFLEPGRIHFPFLEFLPGCLDDIVTTIRDGLQWDEGKSADTKGECTCTRMSTTGLLTVLKMSSGHLHNSLQFFYMFLVNLWVLQYVEGKVICIWGKLCGTNKIREVVNDRMTTDHM